MSEWILLFIAIPFVAAGFIHFYKSFRNVRLLRALNLYLPAFYFLIILVAVVSHFLFPAQIIGEGKTQFSIGASIGIMFSIPGFFAIQFAMQLAEIVGLGFLIKYLENSWPVVLVSFIAANFVTYWIINLIFAYAFPPLKRLFHRLEKR